MVMEAKPKPASSFSSPSLLHCFLDRKFYLVMVVG
jgi:hypothetical protein